MNVKIKADNVNALFPNNGPLSYEQIYQSLCKEIPSNDFIFTKRTPGAGFLQWDLPGDGWISLKDADPLIANQVSAERERLFGVVMKAFGGNQQLAKKVLTVPGDDYVFFRPNAQGNVELKITVWGYKYPTLVEESPIEVSTRPKIVGQDSVITLLYDGNPLPNYEFFIDGFKRVTGIDGKLALGALTTGSVYTITNSAGYKSEITITPGCSEYMVDVTVYVTLNILVYKDGAPADGVKCKVNYWGHILDLTTSVNGSATATLPLDKNAGDCVINVENQVQRRPLQIPSSLFQFDIETEKEPVVTPQDNNIVNEPPHVKVPEEDVVIEEPKLDDELHDDNEDSSDIKISVEDENGQPVKNGTILFEQQGHPGILVHLDSDGTAFLSQDVFVTNTPLSAVITINGIEQKPFEFELEDGENEYLLSAVVKQGRNNRFLELLAALGGVALTCGFCYIILHIVKYNFIF